MKKLIQQFGRFAVVGGICFLIDYGLLIVLTEFANWHYLISAATSFSVSVIVNYILSLRFVFRSRKSRSRIKEFLLFVGLSLIGLGLNQLLMWIGVDHLNIHYLIAKIGATVVVTVYNFISRKIVLEK